MITPPTQKAGSVSDHPQEEPLRDSELDKTDRTEVKNKLESDMLGVIEHNWDLAQQIREQGAELNIITKDENNFFSVPPKIRQASELQSAYDNAREELKHATDPAEKAQLQEQIVSLFIEFSFNTALLLKKNFNARLQELTATPIDTEDNEVQQELDKTNSLLKLIHESGVMLVRLAVFNKDVENILRKVDLPRLAQRAETSDATASTSPEQVAQASELRLKELLFKLNQILYVQLDRNVADLPESDQVQATVLPEQINKLTDISPKKIAELLESLSRYKEELEHKKHQHANSSTTAVLDEGLKEEQANLKNTVEETYELNQPEEVEGAEPDAQTKADDLNPADHFDPDAGKTFHFPDQPTQARPKAA